MILKICDKPNYMIGEDDLFYRIKAIIDKSDFALYLKCSGKKFKEIDNKLRIVSLIDDDIIGNEQYVFLKNKIYILDILGVEGRFL